MPGPVPPPPLVLPPAAPGARRRWLVLAAGVLLATPSAFGFFPELRDAPLAGRAVAAAVWAVVVVATAARALRRDERVERIVTGATRQREQLRLQTVEEVLTALLRPSTKGIPQSYELGLYGFDPDGDALLPVWPDPDRGPADVRVFRSGRGATGIAFERRALFLVTGDDVANSRWGLSADQQAWFRDCAVVVATPVWSPEGDRPLGVLTALARADDGFFEHPSHQAGLRELADTVGMVMVALAGWDTGIA